MYRFLSSFAAFTMALGFILIGLIGVLLPWSLAMQLALVQFILSEGLVLTLFGLALITIGAAWLSYLFLGAKRPTYFVRSDAQAIEVDEPVFQSTVGQYCRQLIPDKETPCKVELKRDKICISADFPFLPIEEQLPFLNRFKSGLQRELSDKIGYRNGFHLYATFEREKQ